jgi:hypothetical protein
MPARKVREHSIMPTDNDTRGVHGCSTATAPDEGGLIHITDPRAALERVSRRDAGDARV